MHTTVNNGGNTDGPTALLGLKVRKYSAVYNVVHSPNSSGQLFHGQQVTRRLSVNIRHV